MALHIQMSDEALAELQKTARTNRLVSAGVCLGLLLLFGGILYFTILIIQNDVEPSFITYTEHQDDAPPTANPVTKELSSKSAAASPNVTPSVIVAQNTVSAVAAPVSIDTTGELQIGDMNLSMGMGGLGDGLGNGGGGLGSGTSGGSALEGTFYDLKLTKGRAPSRIPDVTQNGNKKILKIGNNRSGHEFDGEISRFINSGFQESLLKNYFQSPTKLYATNWFLPSAQSSYAPKAFKCDDISQPGGWICVYRGRVRAPKSGKFRFIGAGDEFIVVRFNKKVVLEAGYHHPSIWNKDNADAVFTYGPAGARGGGWQKFWDDVKSGKYKQFSDYELIKNVPNITRWNNELGGLTAGSPIEVKEGQTYPIEIAVGDIDGKMGFVLLIEEMVKGHNTNGAKLDIFRTNFSTPNAAELRELLGSYMDGSELQAPPYNDDSLIWTAVP